MKPSTKQAMQSIEDVMCAHDFTRIRRGVLRWKADAPINVCLSIGYREWADGVCTLNPVLQSVWDDIEKKYANISSQKYKKYDQPTVAKLILFDPPLNYFAGIFEAEVNQRLANWWKYTGLALAAGISDPSLLLQASLNALMHGSFRVNAAKAYLMDRLINPQRSRSESYELILKQLSREWDIQQFQDFYSTHSQRCDF